MLPDVLKSIAKCCLSSLFQPRQVIIFSREKIRPYELKRTTYRLGCITRYIECLSSKDKIVAEKSWYKNLKNYKNFYIKALWYKNGKLHRDDELPSYINLCLEGGYFGWYKNGQLHRDSYPAEIWFSRAKEFGSVLDYKWRRHGLESSRPWINSMLVLRNSLDIYEKIFDIIAE